MRLGRINVTIGTFGSRLASREEREKISFPAQRTSLFGATERKEPCNQSNEARGASPGGLGKVRIPGSSLGGENRKLGTKARSPCSSEGWEGGCVRGQSSPCLGVRDGVTRLVHCLADKLTSTSPPHHPTTPIHHVLSFTLQGPLLD